MSTQVSCPFERTVITNEALVVEATHFQSMIPPPPSSLRFRHVSSSSSTSSPLENKLHMEEVGRVGRVCSRAVRVLVLSVSFSKRGDQTSIHDSEG